MKNEIRREFKIKRKELKKCEVSEKSKKACDLFLESDFYKNADVLMLYMPLGNETDTTDIINRALSDGKKVVFPVTDRKSGEITPCYATAETKFEKGAFSIKEPSVLDVAEPLDIDTVIVPGIAFSKNGARVGFGKGCYDRFLVKTNAVKIGFCFELQFCEEIYAEEYDIKMDCIITENRVIICKK